MDDEPDWRTRFKELISEQSPKLASCLRQNDAFELVLREWRRWHCTPVTIDGEPKRMPAPAVDGIIALAELGIMPPKSLWGD